MTNYQSLTTLLTFASRPRRWQGLRPRASPPMARTAVPVRHTGRVSDKRQEVPSPVGHALAGVAVAWVADLVPGNRGWRSGPPETSWVRRAGGGLTVTCLALAAAPDLDLLFHGHRTVTHSIGAGLFVGLFAAALAANAGRPIARVALMCAAAWGSHILLDWLAVDPTPPRGIQALWPFSEAWYISGIDLFAATARYEMTSLSAVSINLIAVAQEVAILLPLVIVAWLVRVEALARLAPELSGRDHAAQ